MSELAHQTQKFEVEDKLREVIEKEMGQREGKKYVDKKV